MGERRQAPFALDDEPVLHWELGPGHRCVRTDTPAGSDLITAEATRSRKPLLDPPTN